MRFIIKEHKDEDKTGVAVVVVVVVVAGAVARPRSGFKPEERDEVGTKPRFGVAFRDENRSKRQRAKRKLRSFFKSFKEVIKGLNE